MSVSKSTQKTESAPVSDLFEIDNLPPIPEPTSRELKLAAAQKLGKSRADMETLDKEAEAVFQMWLKNKREPIMLDSSMEFACATTDLDELREMDKCMAYDDDKYLPEGVNSMKELDVFNEEHRSFKIRFETARIAQARMVEKCQTCPVRLECLASSVTIQDERGAYTYDDSGQVYGGYGAETRKKILHAWTKKGSDHYYQVAEAYQEMMDRAETREEIKAARTYAVNMGYIPEDLED